MKKQQQEKRKLHVKLTLGILVKEGLKKKLPCLTPAVNSIFLFDSFFSIKLIKEATLASSYEADLFFQHMLK